MHRKRFVPQVVITVQCVFFHGFDQPTIPSCCSDLILNHHHPPTSPTNSHDAESWCGRGQRSPRSLLFFAVRGGAILAEIATGARVAESTMAQCVAAQVEGQLAVNISEVDDQIGID